MKKENNIKAIINWNSLFLVSFLILLKKPSLEVRFSSFGENLFLFISFIIVFIIFEDFIRVYYSKTKLLINIAGYIPFSFFFGSGGILIASILGFFISFFKRAKRLNLDSFQSSFFRMTRHTLTFYLAHIVSSNINTNLLLRIVIFIVTSKLMNFILFDVPDIVKTGNMEKLFETLKYEGIYLISLIPATYSSWIATNPGLSVILYLPNVFIAFSLKMLTEYNELLSEERIERSQLERINKILQRLMEILRSSKLKRSTRMILNEIAEFLRVHMGYKYVLISLFDYSTGKVIRITHRGLSPEQYEEAKRKAPPIDRILDIYNNTNFRTGNVTFIPEEADYQLIKRFTIDPEKRRALFESMRPGSWKRGDVLLIFLVDEMGKPIGYISCDQPVSNLRPTSYDFQILEMISFVASNLVTNSLEFLDLVDKLSRDQLTGLYNHSKFYEDIEALIESGTPFTLLMMDLDDFKKVNDKYGHVTGDKILQAVAEAILKSIRKTDRAYRYGGEEFAVILKFTKTSDAKNIAERIREAVKSMKMEIDIKITISIGISEYPKDAINPEELVNIADMKLYEAKNSGKDKVVA